MALNRQQKAGLPAKLAGTAVLAASALLAAACSSTTAGTAAAGATTLTVEASPTGPIADNFNPFDTTGPAVLLGASSMVYEPLLQYNLEDPGQVYPWLATSYSFSDGDKTLTFQLRKNVKWSNGAPFTSKDVVFTFEELQKYPAINSLGISFASVSAAGPYTVVMHFASPGYVQLYNIAGDTPIVPEAQWSSVNPASFADSHPIGTGPYLVSSITSRGITLTRNPHYWQPGLPKIDKLVYNVYDSNTSANLDLENGTLDWAGNFVPHIQQVYKSRDPSERFYEFLPYRTAYLALNLTKYPFGNVTVRKALSLALDRPAVIDAGEYGEQPAAVSPTGLVLPSMAGDLAPAYAGARYSRDLSQAVSMLESAGFRRTSSGKLMEPDGAPFDITIIGPSPYTDVMADDQVVAQQWDRLGATVTVQGEAVGTWIDQTYTGAYQVSLVAGDTPEIVNPYGSYNELLNSTLAAPVGKTSLGDQEHFVSAQADALLAQWASATTAAARQQAMDGIEQIMVNDVPAIPLFYNVYFCEWTTSSVTGWPTAADNYEVPDPGGIQAEVVVLHLRPAT